MPLSELERANLRIKACEIVYANGSQQARNDLHTEAQRIMDFVEEKTAKPASTAKPIK